MKDKFFAIGYHGTDAQYTPRILSNIDFTINKGDKFLGQGFYLWRDSYDRAYEWSQATKSFQNIDILYVKVECKKEYVLNFTSQSWGNENMLLEMHKNYFSNKTFGEFIDYLIYYEYLEINMIVIIDLTKNQTIFNIKDRKNETNFAFGDIQICLKNDKTIIEIDKVV